MGSRPTPKNEQSIVVFEPLFLVQGEAERYRRHSLSKALSEAQAIGANEQRLDGHL